MLASCCWDPWDDNSVDSSYDDPDSNNNYDSDYNDSDDSYDSDDILRPRQHAQTIDIP